MRKCVEVMVQGLRLRGTVHIPPASRSASTLDDLGAVILHPGVLPRSGQGDFAVALADAMAGAGVCTVRMDLPGLGDSEGNLPETALAFVQMVQEGGLAEVTCECVEQLKAKLGFKRVLLGGHCGGAITAFFAVASRHRPKLDGLFILDMPLSLVLAAQAPGAAGGPAPATKAWRAVAREIAKELYARFVATRVGAVIRQALRAVRSSLRKPVARTTPATGGGELPPQPNLTLLKCVERVLKTGLPVLFVTATDARGKSGNGADYVETLIPGRDGQVAYHKITGTDHAFLAGDGKPKAISHVTNWVGGRLAGDNA
jgi:alpha-beta hydrolase superfamily lysophospholipase